MSERIKNALPNLLRERLARHPLDQHAKHDVVGTGVVPAPNRALRKAGGVVDQLLRLPVVACVALHLADQPAILQVIVEPGGVLEELPNR